MRKSSSPSLSNCNSVLANKIFGIPLDELQQGGHPDNEVPFIVRHVVDYIEEHGGLEQQGLFQVNGNAETVEWLRQRYDSGEEVDLVKEADVPSAISLLRFFLQELPEPVIPGSLHIHLMQLSQDYNNEDEFGRKLRFLLQQLPPVNYSLLKFLCRFLANVASHHEEIWSANSLAAVFGPDVFHIYTDVEDMKEQEIVSRIMAGLLENYYEFFENEEEDFSSNDLSSITEQVNELSEEEEEDEKLEHIEELPEEGAEKSNDMPEVVQLRMTENILESNSVTATSTHISPISILPASTDILERTIRAAVEQHLFDLQSSIDHDLKNLQQQSVVCNNEAESIHCDGEGSNNQIDIADDIINASESNRDCSKPVASTNLDNEAMQQDCVFENEENTQSVGILLEPCSDRGDSEDGCLEREEYLLFDSDKLSHLILDSSSKICDLNANTESEVPGGQSVGVQGEAACVSIPHLDLKNVSDGDKWEASCPITFPLIDFKTMHLQRDGEEPFPAFKSWQEDSESGEAQLSPQAGRMNHHPLEEDCPPVLSHRSLDFGQSQRFLHDPEKLDSSSKALSFTRIRRSSFSSKDEKREDRTPYQLVKKLQKKIRQFEEQFERERNSKPSYSDIAANPKVLKWMTELTKLRKQIKDAKHKNSDGEFVPQTRPRSNTLPKSFGSSLDHEDEENEDEPKVIQKEKKPSKEATLELILKRLKEKRIERCLPEDIKKMTKDHLVEEKASLQKSLLYYESQHGRPVTKEERHIVKPLYDRYRLVKQMLTRASITPVLGSPSTKRRGQMLQPIIEGETAHFFEEIKEEEEDGVNLSSELGDMLKTAVQVQSSLENSESDVEENQEKLALDLRLSSSRAASMPELLEQLWKARAEKKKLRKTLREFEEAFYQQNGRNAQKEDRVPVLEEYREYKKIKAKLRLLEVLISKQDSSKSI
ncbi:protein FAM13B isoform X1 [Homo sapiens]|uniref:Protein FAM13B n=2 Tax=Homo sapiens TaxID=9606 RepID=A0A8I5KSB9_HUMAN|nr:protein FAM13B isoform 6 [Homo sapiens]XP_006714711.1 protein FAM13B isoform X1 [Homo sapiens]XP_011541750.1 protein FAM13B isoform X1 [Homo sapiens]XP_011541751.1 protein FAM13B isoform X1 [Homo sapiens]XP_011541752.1 protein FAM13B isoform X1 [Homo sapiens]XP_024301875.1 protein FAM13B isoform X1 [Homo sapiens]XP_047273238.1 protein FAM13B isoform X1 [Homo sapiens]XP_047273239.1 protein FAM13B isoform X1 [Homo sapiens]XP_054208736.1 protein FAM13B isoform X1 [Homo sapiens]XP_054208737|eukprot:XP_006714710.1 protein FAM13B isoform X1 [Homo sapiens]